MNSFHFSLFLLITLGFSIFSASATTGNTWNTSDNTQFTVNLTEGLELSSNFSQNVGDSHSIMLSEHLELLNYDRYQSMVTASKHISDTKAIMERVLPNTRLRLTDGDNLVGSGSNTSISDFIETITDTFYQGGAKTPSIPTIPIEITTTGTGVSLQTLQLMDTSQNVLESQFDDTGQSWSDPTQYSKSQYSSKFSLVNPIEKSSSNLSEINLSKLDSPAVLVVLVPFAIYFILVAGGVIRPPNTPNIPQSTSFYFVLACYLLGTISTPLSIGQSYWGMAYGEMDNSTDNSTNSTDMTNPEYISVNLTDEEESVVLPLQNTTLTETDNVADSDGPKHYTVLLSESLNVGDGPSNETQNPNELTTQQTEIPSENSTNIQISESISFFDYVTSGQQATIPSENSTNVQISESILFFDYSVSGQQATIPSENSTNVQISESISFFDYSVSGQQATIPSENSTNIQISESISFFDYPIYDSSIVSDRTINLNEQIEFSDGADGLSNITTVEISEHITFGSDNETVLYTPLREIVEIQEELSIDAQITVNGIAEITVSEHIEFSEKITIKSPDIRLLEVITFSESLQNQLTLLPLEDIPYLGLLSQDSIIILNGTTNVVADQDIANTTNTLTISAWINPKFNTGSPQYTIVSKEYSFDLYLTNILEPIRTTGFSVFDGAQWKTVTGNTVLDEKWHHVVVSVAGSNISLYVDGLLDGELELEDGIIIQESQITSDDLDIVIGAYVNTVNVPKPSNMFAGEITLVDVYSRMLTAEQVYQKYQTDMDEFHKTVSLYETVQVGEYIHYESPFYVMLDETLELYEFTSGNYVFPADPFHVRIDETLELHEFTSEDVDYSDNSDTTNTLTISAWINPKFNTGSPQYTIVSKEYSFDLYLTNILEPIRTTGFSVFDGAQWKTVTGNTVLDEKWHQVIASVDGTTIALYVDGLLEGELKLEDGVAIDNSKLVFQDSQILPDDSDIVIGAYVNTVNVPKTSNEFAGEITSVDVYTRALTAEDIYNKYQTDMQEFYKTVSLYETIQVDEYVNYEVIAFNPSDVQLEEHLAFYDEIIAFNPSDVQLEEHIAFYDEIAMSILYTIQLEEHLAFYDEVTGSDPSRVQLEEHLTLYDEVIIYDPFDIQLEESLQFDDSIIALNPFVPSVNPEIQMVKSGFMITENPKFELEYYSEDDAAKIDRKEIENATSIANQVQEDLASTPVELLTRPGINEINTALQVIETSLTISELEDQVEQIPEDVNAEDIKQLQEKVEEVTEAIEDTAKSLGETHLEDKAEKIEKSAEMIRVAAEITQNANQTGTWHTTDEDIITKIIAPDGSIFADDAFFEKEREGKFDVEVLSDAVAKPGIYTVESTITVDQTEYTINEEFAWGLVSLNTKKSTYYPGETAEFEIVVLDSVGSPVCDASLVMSINGTTLSSGAGITPNPECGIYDSAYDTGAEGTYHVEISAIADGIQTGFETTFDVAEFVEFDIIRTAQSKIDPVHNPNKFEVVIDVTSHTNSTGIQIVESVPSVFDVITDGNIVETADGKTITWDRTLQDQTAQIKYTYSVPFIFPELYPLGEAVINYGNQTFTEARPWFVANDPDIGSGWKKKVLSTDPTVISGASDVTNYPVPVTLTFDPELSTSSVGTNGEGIRFTHDGTELVDFEIESYSGNANYGNVTAWVELPNLSASVSTYFYIHYGKTTAQSDAAATAAAVWAGNSYVVVNHLDDTPTSTDNDVEMIGSIVGTTYAGVTTVATDDDFATGVLGSGTSMGAGNSIPGKISKGLILNHGSDSGQFVCLDTENQNDYNACGGNGRSDIFSGTNSGTFWKSGEGHVRSVSLWYKAADVSGTYRYIFEEGASNGQAIYLLENKIYGVTSRSSQASHGETATTANEWHHVALVWHDDSNSYLYHDGVLADTFTGKDHSHHSNPGALGMVQGNAARHVAGENTEGSGGPYEFDGIIDELRVTNTELSANLISVTYNVEKNPTDFTCSGICLTETLSMTDTSFGAFGETEIIVLTAETLSFTDSTSTISNAHYPDSWSKKLLSTNSALVAGSANLNNVPVLVKLTDDPDLSLTSVGENGIGIRFSSPTWDFLDFEIEHYEGDKTDGSLVAWVKIPTLDFDDDTPFYIHYGQPIGNGTASSSYNNVWAGNTAMGYVVVNHLSDSTDTNPATRELKGSRTSPSVSDASTKDDFNVVNMASNGQVDAKIGKGIELDGSNDFICLNHSSGDNPDNFNCSNNESSTLFDPDVVNRTYTLWYNADTVTGDRKMYTLFEEGGSGNGLNIYLYEGKLYAGAWVGSTASGWVSIATTANEWHHVAFVFSDHNNDEEIKMYYDGQTSNALTITGFNMGSHNNEDCLGATCRSTEVHLGDDGHSNAEYNDSKNLTIGGTTLSYDFTGEFDGTLDEFRVIDSVLSAAFIETTYNSENNPDNFILHTTGISISETLSMTDTSTGVKGASTTTVTLPAETLSFTDSVSNAANISVSETLSFTDSVSNAASISISETLSMTDTTTGVEDAKEVEISETLSFTDGLSKEAGISISETLSMTDTSTGVEDAKEVEISETLSLTDIPPVTLVAKDAENLTDPEYVEVFTIGTSTYAIVTQPDEDRVTIYDVSDPTNIVVTDTETDGNNNFSALEGATAVDTFTLTGTYAGTYAIVTADQDSGVQIIDVSNPSAIVAKDKEFDPHNGFTKIYSPTRSAEIFTVASNSTATYAIVTDYNARSGTDGVQIIDVSNPSAIVAMDTEEDGQNDFDQLQGAFDADIFTVASNSTATYAIVTAIGSWNSNGIQIIDVSNPSAIVAKGEFAHANLEYPGGVETFTIGTSTYAIVTGYTAGKVQILDISDPTNIVAKDHLANSDSLELEGAYGVDVFTVGASTYAIVTGYLDHGVQIIDVSDPTDITAVNSLADSGSLELEGADGVDTFTIGLTTYAIVVSLGDDGVQIIQLFTDEEFVKKSINISVSETLSFTDSVSNAASISISETLSMTDTSTGVKDAREVEISETLSFTDSVSNAAGISISETLSFTDTATGVKDTREVEISETLSFTVAGGVTSDGSVDKFTVPGTVEINDLTVNGPVLDDQDRFGQSIANIGDLDGDGVDDLAVGAVYDDGPGNVGSNHGAVHIMFMNTDGSVDSTVAIYGRGNWAGATTNGPEIANGFHFGWSVENVGDIDGDGKNEIAAGAIRDPSGGDTKGAVNIMFMNDDGSGSIDSTIEINDLTANGPTLNNGDRFGYSIANIGDLDGDGNGDLAVGAAYDDGGGINRGAVHIMFMGSSGSVKSTVEINDSTSNGPTLADEDYFGRSIENIGDLKKGIQKDIKLMKDLVG